MTRVALIIVIIAIGSVLVGLIITKIITSITKLKNDFEKDDFERKD